MERQEIPTVKEELEQELDQDMYILPTLTNEDGTLEAVEKIIDPDVSPLVEREPPVIISPTYNATPETTPGVRKSSQFIVKTKKYYTPIILGKQYESVNT